MSDVQPAAYPVAVEFCQALVAKDWTRMRSAVGEDLHIAAWGTTRYAGMYESADALVGLVESLDQASDGTLRLNHDDFDVLTSPHHLALQFFFLAERGQRKLEGSYQLWQFSSRGEKLSGYGDIYVADQATWDAFWS